jgi:hypothetical protein
MRLSAAVFVPVLACAVAFAPALQAVGQQAPGRPTLAGFTLGDGFATAARLCGRRFRFERDPQGTAGTCYGTPRPIGYPVSSVFLRDCDRRLCQITVRARVEGEAQLEEAIGDISRAWDEQYGAHSEVRRVTIPGADANDCVAALGGGHHACLLRGTAMLVRNWTGPAGQLAAGQRAQLVVTGSEGSRVASVRMTLATGAGISESRERDL